MRLPTKKGLLAAQDVGLCLVRKWWRPFVQIGIGGSLLVNGIVLPLATSTVPDLTGLAAVIAAASPFAIMRGFEKKWGAADV